MTSTRRVHGPPAAPPAPKGLTSAELKHGLSRIGESGFEDAHPVKGQLPAKVKANAEKVKSAQGEDLEFYQVSIKGHAVYASVQYGDPANAVHAFDAAGKPLISGTWKTDGDPVSWK